MYEHLNIQIPELAVQETQDGSGQRLYRTPKGDLYPSITTILSPLKKEIITKWRERVGNKVADIECQWGRERGTAIHLAVEEFIKNKGLVGQPLLVRMLVEDLMPYLRKIGKIHCQEVPLFSDLFRTAGRCDCIAEYSNKLSIVDFKTSKRPKRIEWIEDYFLQTSFYAYAYWERTGYKIEQSVILIATEQGQAQEFIVYPWLYWKKLKDVRKDYKDEFGI
jgi:genome maintenance exonuclease 1